MKKLLRLYPMAWRERYGAEFEALLEDLPACFPHVLDVIIGALDAWIHFNSAVRAEGRIPNVTHLARLTRIASMIIAAAVLDLSIAALGAFAWFDGNAPVALWMSAAGISATLAFVVIAAQAPHQAWRKAA